jgi:hypothetical protein
MSLVFQTLHPETSEFHGAINSHFLQALKVFSYLFFFTSLIIPEFFLCFIGHFFSSGAHSDGRATDSNPRVLWASRSVH